MRNIYDAIFILNDRIELLTCEAFNDPDYLLRPKVSAIGKLSRVIRYLGEENETSSRS